MNKVIPPIGAKGLFDLAPPFNLDIANGVEYSCKSIRRISEILANNEDPFKDIYEPKGITKDIYDEDVKEDAFIIGLQSRKGHWIYVPYRYVSSYADGSGVNYRTVMINASLPSIPVTTELEGIMDDIKDIILAQLGVNCKMSAVETSKVVLIPMETHLEKQLERDLRKTSPGLFARVNELLIQNNQLLTKVADLENFIKQHHG